MPMNQKSLWLEARRKIPCYQLGFSLVEFMVAIMIGLFLVGGLATFIVSSSSTRNELEKTNRQIENGRYAIEKLSEAIKLAGYYGIGSGIIPAPAGAAPANFPDPCSVTPTDLLAALAISIQGYEYKRTDAAPSTMPITCLPKENYQPGTDILVIRRAQTTALPLGTDGKSCPGSGEFKPNEIYLESTVVPPSTKLVSDVGPPIPSNYFGNYFIVDKGANSSAFILKKGPSNDVCADIRKLKVEIYYVSPCSKPDTDGKCKSNSDNGAPIPTLKMMELTYDASGTRFQEVPLVEGIENLQLDYGVDTDNDRMPDTYGTASQNHLLTVAGWHDVMAVKAYILARNIDPTTGYKDSKKYYLGVTDTDPPSGYTVPTAKNDGYKRQVYSATIYLENSRKPKS